MNVAVKLSTEEFAQSLNMRILENGGGEILFTTDEINRPGLQFTGYYEHFSARRVQLIGNAEMYYLYSLSQKVIAERMEFFMNSGVPCVVCARGKTPPVTLLKQARASRVPVFVSDQLTGDVSHHISEYLERRLAPKILMHGVLLDVFGVGVLLQGDSGMGKSETALELIKAGHRLVADDVVEITRASDKLIGSAPEKIRHLMEVRGIGVVDVRYLYGVGAILTEKQIDMVMEMELWNENADYERIGDTERTKEILGVQIPATVLPISPGRNLAVVVEVAARTFRLKGMGYKTAGSFALDGLEPIFLKSK